MKSVALLSGLLVVSVALGEEAPPPKSPAWTTFAENGAYVLRERPLSKHESLIHGAFFESDAQMGIAIAIELGLLSEKKAAAWFRSDRDPAKLDKYTALIEQLPEAVSNTGKEVRFTQVFVIQFLDEEPEGNAEKPVAKRALNATTYAQLGRMKRDRTRPRKPAAKSE